GRQATNAPVRRVLAPPAAAALLRRSRPPRPARGQVACAAAGPRAHLPLPAGRSGGDIARGHRRPARGVACRGAAPAARTGLPGTAPVAGRTAGTPGLVSGRGEPARGPAPPETGEDRPRPVLRPAAAPGQAHPRQAARAAGKVVSRRDSRRPVLP